MKKELFDYLNRICSQTPLEENEIFTAAHMAEQMKASRNAVSQYLNEGVRNHEIIKINSRPVYFYSRKAVEKQFQKRNKQDIYESFDAFLEDYQNSKNDFEALIGYDNSLRNVVEHCKAAISYPGNGLPILINGPTGTGKSMIASLMYQYALNQKIISPDKKFVAVNCSEYAHNPELLTSNLFGHVKGAYTGADEENEGLISLADGGVLFLDEVHCLKAECQEKLFFFMDKGIYHKVGDNEKWYSSNVRVIFATTEDPHDVLLKTLLRRIPITVSVPSLKERPLIEKSKLICSILRKESERLHRKIEISNMAYQTLMDYEFVGNVGSLQNVIKATCANAFLFSKNSSKLEVHVQNLPEDMFTSITTVQTKTSGDMEHLMLTLEQLEKPYSTNSAILHLYERILSSFQEYEINHVSFEELIHEFESYLQNYIDYTVFRNSYKKNATDEFLLKLLDKIYSIIMNKYSLKVPNSEIQIYSGVLSEYTKNMLDAKIWVSSHLEDTQRLVALIQEKRPREFSIAQEMIENICLNLDVDLDEMMLVILSLSFIGYDNQLRSDCVGVILCHGYSTASSISSTVNRLLNEYIFDGIDMQIDLSIDKVALMADEYLARKSNLSELILLVDMGSLEEIYKRIKPITNCNIGLLNNVSTRMALEVGMGFKQGLSVKEILEKVENNFELSTHYIEGKEKSEVILTVCATGFGAAQKFSELFSNSLPHSIPLKILPYDYQSLATNGLSDPVFTKYNVSLVVGTLDPKIAGIDFLPVENIMMNEGLEKLTGVLEKYIKRKEVDDFKKQVVKNFNLSNIIHHLTILNAEKVIDDVEEVVQYLEEDFHMILDATSKAGLYVHMSCLIERLILKNGIEDYEGLQSITPKQRERIEIIKNAFSGVGMRYSVELSDAEALFILNYFGNK